MNPPPRRAARAVSGPASPDGSGAGPGAAGGADGRAGGQAGIAAGRDGRDGQAETIGSRDGQDGRAETIGGQEGQAGRADGQAGATEGQAGPADGQAGPADGQAGATDGQASQPPVPPGQAGSRPRPSRAKSRARRRISWWTELLGLFVFALLIMLAIKTYVVQAFYIPSSSMENTLDVGDKVLVNKLVYHFRPIERGDIVVFNGEGSWDPPGPPGSSDPIVRWASQFGHAVVGLFGISPGVHDYIKRVIGVPGDHVACCDARGRITVNGVPLSEKSYLFAGNPPSMTRFRITVPPGRLWVMGDHRTVSYDSRGHIGDPGGGTVPESQVVGRAFMILWPPSRFRVLPIPVTFNGLNAGHALGGLTTPGAPLVLAAAVAGPVTWLDRRRRPCGAGTGRPYHPTPGIRRWPGRR
jgi:signal peptidase I